MTGVVYKSTGSWYHVKDAQGKLIPCRIKGKFRIEGLTSTNPVAVGDVVEVTIKDTQDGQEGVITDIQARKNYIVRKSVKSVQTNSHHCCQHRLCFFIGNP